MIDWTNPYITNFFVIWDTIEEEEEIPIPPPSGFFLLQEDLSAILQENLDKIEIDV